MTTRRPQRPATSRSDSGLGTKLASPAFVSASDSPFGGNGSGPMVRRHSRRIHVARRYDKFIDAVRSSLWFRPALWMIVFSLLALGLVWFDTWLDARVKPEQIPRLLRSDPDDARALLGAIVGAMLTVVSLAFSVVMLAVVQMSNAYSPRLLRLYIGDVYNQHVLGILLGTFVYSLIVLRSVRHAGFAPTIATNIGVVFAMLATIALIAFLHHVPQSIKVNSIIRMILEGCEEELDRSFPAGVGVECENVPADDELEGEPQQIVAKQSGYVQIFDLTPLAERERSDSAVIHMHWRMGDFVLEGTSLASVWGRFDEQDREALERACVFGTERTMHQDPRFGIEQLTDVALRALSPGYNDPTTACAVIDALTILFGQLIVREGVTLWRSDRSGQLRLRFNLASPSELVDLSYLRILDYGARDQQVLRRLIGTCEQLQSVARDSDQREILWELLQAIHATACDRIQLGPHRRTLDGDFERACATLRRPRLARLASELILAPNEAGGARASRSG